MKNTTFYRLLLMLTVVFTYTACDTVDFDDINVNTNDPSDASTASLLTSSQRLIGAYLGSTTPNLYVQYLSNGQYDEESRYQTLNWSYNAWYANLTNLNRIIELNSNEETMVAAQANGSNANQIAVATILRVYFLQGMTNRWGQIPYTQALQGLESPRPAYDSQEVIYTGLFNELDDALALMDDGTGPTGDILLNGNMERWSQFANTLKMTMALRLSKANPTLGKAKFNEALGKTISSNSENIMYQFLSDEANDNPWEDRFFAPDFRRDYLISDVFVDELIGSGSSSNPEDPRLPKMAEPATNTGTFVGAPYGKSNSATDNYSFITSDIIANPEAPLYIFTYAEVLFARAEAAELDWTSEDAEMLYEDAIAASMDQWGVDAGAAQAYIAKNPYMGLESIGYEKWVAMFLQGYESWTEWRRMRAMGYEKELEAPEDMLSNATGIPDRQAYGATAPQLNAESYNAAISAQGPDVLNTVIWLFK